MPSLDRKLVVHRLPIKPRYRPFNKLREELNQKLWRMSKQKSFDYMKQNLFSRVDMLNGFIVWFLYIRKMVK